MKVKSIFLIGLLFVSILSFAQNNKTTSTKKALTGIDKIMTNIGYPYKKYNDSVATIVFDGTAIKTYTVMVMKVGKLYVAFLNLTEALNIKVDPSKYKYLLESNSEYDFIKIGLTENEEVFIRYETTIDSFNTASFKSVIDQMTDAAEALAPKLR